MSIQNRVSKLVFSCILAFLLMACASGSAIVTGTTRPATDPESVKLYLKEPQKYEIIGLVEASSDAGWTEQGAQDYAVAELKNQAAKLGANGVLLTATGPQTSAIYGTTTAGKVVNGQAIFVIEE
jgi:hypothetical protein